MEFSFNSFRNLIILGLCLSVNISTASTDLLLESWRSDDNIAWSDNILPIFQAVHPEINVLFNPTTAVQYDASVLNRSVNNEVGDIISCRPFSRSQELFKRGFLMELDSTLLPNIFDDSAMAWTIADKSIIYCLPLASVIHGFAYNKTYFDKHNFSIPETIEDFFSLLESIKKEGSLIPLSFGTYDGWSSAELGYNNIGPSHWNGDAGKRLLLNGQQNFTHPNWIAPFQDLKRWGEYMGKEYEYRTYADSVDLFVSGKAAIFPSGSWEISTLENNALFDLGAFPPPKLDNNSRCVVTNHPDMGIGIYSNSKHKEEALTFLNWLTSDMFRELYAIYLPGFYLFGENRPDSDSELSEIFLSWLDDCDSTIRFNAQLNLSIFPNFEQDFWSTVAEVINGNLSPEDAGKALELPAIHQTN